MKALIYTSLASVIALCTFISFFALHSSRLDGEPFADVRVLEPAKMKPAAGGNNIAGPLEDRSEVNTSRADPSDKTQAGRDDMLADREQDPENPGESVVVEIRDPAPGTSESGPQGNAIQNNPVVSPVPNKTTENFPNVPDKMVAVPVKALVEYTKYGLIPRVSADGRKPSDIYARPSQIPSQVQPGEPARIAILINGLGQSTIATQDAINKLPAAITLAFGPYGSNLQGWVRMAREAGHEVILQIPLEPYDYPDNDPGPHTLLTSLPPEENLNRLKWLMARFTGYVGLTNAMGEKFLTADSSLQPIMREIKERGLIFVDDKSAARSAADKLAGELGMGYSSAEVVLDAEKTKEHLDQALDQLVKVAQERGLAFGVGTNLPLTIEKIAAWSKSLSKKGIVLVPVSAAVRVRQRT